MTDMMIGARTIGLELPWDVAVGFREARLSTEGRHLRRLSKVARLEQVAP